MKAFVTSIGEPTTDLCVWSLERLELEVELIQDDTPLAYKLEKIYNLAESSFIRVDADIVPNQNVLELTEYHPTAWWVQGKCFGWYAQSLINGGVQFIRTPAIPYLRKAIKKHLKAERPESQMYRLPEFHDPRRCVASDIVCGLHGWNQNDLERVKEVKRRRGQYENYDWDLVERMAAL